MSLPTNSVVLITGGGSGIGFATARLFGQDGAKVAIVGRDAAKLRAAAERIGSGVSAFPCDATDADAVATMVAQVEADLGPLTILVNNAGANIKARTMRELTPAAWDQLVSVNLNAAFYCIRAVLPGMLARGGGLIINISSTAGKRAHPLAGAAYCASKFGVAALGHCLAAEEREAGIRVTNIFPGEVDTPILENRPTPVSDAQRATILQPDDVAAAVRFVASLPVRAHVPELIIKPSMQLYY